MKKEQMLVYIYRKGGHFVPSYDKYFIIGASRDPKDQHQAYQSIQDLLDEGLLEKRKYYINDTPEGPVRPGTTESRFFVSSLGKEALQTEPYLNATKELDKEDLENEIKECNEKIEIYEKRLNEAQQKLNTF